MSTAELPLAGALVTVAVDTAHAEGLVFLFATCVQ